MGVYSEALNWANERKHSGGGMRMYRMILALYNGNIYRVDLTDVMSGLDREGQALVCSMIKEYGQRSETDELRAVGKKVIDDPGMQGFVELSMCARDARNSLAAQWEREAELERKDD